jgi:hypothetical protein
VSYTRVVCRDGDFTNLSAIKWCEEQFGPGFRRDYSGSQSRLIKIKALPWYNSGFWFYFEKEADATLFALRWA